MAKMSMRKGFRIGRVISHVVSTVLALWVGGTILTRVGDVMLGECSPFFEGLELIGWEVGNNATATNAGAGGAGFITNAQVDQLCRDNNSDAILYDTGDSGVLSVVGLIGLAAIVLEFVEFKL